MNIIDPDQDNNLKIIDPDIDYHTDDQSMSSPQENYWHNPIARTLADIAIGMGKGGQGLHNAPYYLTKMISDQKAEQLPQFLHPVNQDFGSIFGVKKPNIGDEIIQGASRTLPYAVAGGGGILGEALAGGAYGATQKENPLTGIPLSAAEFALPTAVIKGAKSFIDAPRLYKTLEDTLSEENIKELKESGSKMFEDVLNPIKEHTIINDLKDQNKIMTPLSKIYRTKGSQSDAYKAFDANPTTGNAHALQKEFGEQIGDIKLKKAKGTWDEADRQRLGRLTEARESLLDGINRYIDKNAPELSGAYREAQVNWRDNVSPYVELGRNLQTYNAKQYSPKQIVKNLYYKINEPKANPYIPKSLKQAIESTNDAMGIKGKATGAGLLSGAYLGVNPIWHKIMGALK